MEGLQIEAYYIGTDINPAAICSYETGNSGAWKTRHISPHSGTKGGGNKGIVYTSTDSQGEYRNTAAE